MTSIFAVALGAPAFALLFGWYWLRTGGFQARQGSGSHK